MKIIGFVPLGAVVIASAVGAAVGLAHSDDRAPWEGDRSDLPIGTVGAVMPGLEAELACATAMESATIDYVADPGDLPPPDEAAVSAMAFLAHTDESVTADWGYEWRDLTQTAGAMFVYDDDAGEEGAAVPPRAILYFDLLDDQWRLGGTETCSSG